jgi:hypothetical protein
MQRSKDLMQRSKDLMMMRMKQMERLLGRSELEGMDAAAE